MSNAADRLKLGEAVLALIERKRAETGDESLGTASSEPSWTCSSRNWKRTFWKIPALSRRG